MANKQYTSGILSLHNSARLRAALQEYSDLINGWSVSESRYVSKEDAARKLELEQQFAVVGFVPAYEPEYDEEGEETGKEVFSLKLAPYPQEQHETRPMAADQIDFTKVEQRVAAELVDRAGNVVMQLIEADPSSRVSGVTQNVVIS